MKKKIISCCLGVALLGMIISCGQSEETRRRLSKLERARLDSIDRAALKVGVMPTLDCLPVYVAYEDSLFQQQGVDVHLRYYTAQMDCDTALMNGRVEGSITDLIRGAHLVRKGTPLTYPVATDTYWQLVSNKKARIADLKQLSDKMIAMTRYSATDYLADLAVDSGKPKYDVYRVQINDVNLRLQMLLNNEMDAMLLPEPQATRARLDKHVVLMDSRDKNLNLGAFAFREKALKQPGRKQQLQKFIQAYNIAVDSINSKGVKHYAKLICKYCHVDEKTIGYLPKIKYNHAMEPRRRDLEAAARVARH